MTGLLLGELICLTGNQIVVGILISPICALYYAIQYQRRWLGVLIGALFFMILLLGFENVHSYHLWDVSRHLQDGESVKIKGEIYAVRETASQKILFVQSGTIYAEQNRYYGKIALVMHAQEFDGEIETLLGRQILVAGRYRRLKRPSNEGGFDEETYYHSMGIKCKAEVDNYQFTGKENVILRFCGKIKRNIKSHLSRLGEAVNDTIRMYI